MSQILFSCVVVACLWSMPASPICAQTPSDGAGWFKIARTQFRAGKRFAIQQQYRAALRSYQRALRAVKKAQGYDGVTPKLRHVETTLLYIIARTFEYRKQWCSADNFYRRCLQRGPRPGLMAKATRAKTMLQARLRFSIVLSSTPAGATFAVRSLTTQEQWREVSSPTTVGCGSFMVEARMTGFRPRRKQFDTFGSGATSRSLRFVLTPLQSTRPSGGSVTRPGKPPGEKRWPGVVAWSGVTSAAILGVAGIIMVGIARGEFADVDKKVGDPLESLDQVKTQRDRGVNLQNTGFVFWGLAAVAGGLAAWGFIAKGKSESKTTAAPQGDAVGATTHQPHTFVYMRR